MKKYFLGALVLFGSSSVLSLEIPMAEITYLAPWSPHVDVKVDTTHLDAGCGATDLYRIDLVNDTGGSEKYSMLLAAFMAGKEVVLSINGCVGNRGKIDGIRLSRQ
ncbi:hypothetical protein A3759_18180 [Thalassolituus sp. HI0120]|nr:hypothetical protein A3759_18180 [Thalassolituus sp. HI0120]